MGEYIDQKLPGSQLVLLAATGHCPNLSAPEETIAAMKLFLAAWSRAARRDSAEDLYENAPFGYLSTLPDGTIVRVNQTFETSTGLRRRTSSARAASRMLTRRPDLSRDPLAPLLRMQGRSARSRSSSCAPTDPPARADQLGPPQGRGGPPATGPHNGLRRDRRRSTSRSRCAPAARSRRRRRTCSELLSGELPVGGPRVDIHAGAYLPGVKTLEVGGDWYDA